LNPRALLTGTNVVLLFTLVAGMAIGRWLCSSGPSEPPAAGFDSSSVQRAADLPKETQRVLNEAEPEEQSFLGKWLNPIRPLEPLGGTVFTVGAETLSMSAKYYNRYLIAGLETVDNELVVTSYNPSLNRILSQRVAQPPWWRKFEIRTSGGKPSLTATSARPFHFDDFEILTGRRLIPDPMTYVGAQAQVTFYDKVSARLRLISEPAANIELGYHL
jgi:hypothetical protein